jgi:hypothetical protein
MSCRAALAGLTCSSPPHPGVGRFIWHEDSWVLHGVSRQRPGCALPPASGETLSGGFPNLRGLLGLPELPGEGLCLVQHVRQLRVLGHELGAFRLSRWWL